MRLYFRDEGHLYAKFLFDILTIYPKCHLFQFFSCGIRMDIPILTGFQNGHICRQKNQSYFAKSFSFWSFISEMNVTSIPIVCSIFLLFILNASIYSSLVLRMYIPVLTGVQKGRISLQKTVLFSKKSSVWGFISEIKVICMPNTCSTFWLFILNAIFFSSLVVAYVCTFPS